MMWRINGDWKERQDANGEMHHFYDISPSGVEQHSICLVRGLFDGIYRFQKAPSLKHFSISGF